VKEGGAWTTERAAAAHALLSLGAKHAPFVLGVLDAVPARPSQGRHGGAGRHCLQPACSGAGRRSRGWPGPRGPALPAVLMWVWRAAEQCCEGCKRNLRGSRPGSSTCRASARSEVVRARRRGKPMERLRRGRAGGRPAPWRLRPCQPRAATLTAVGAVPGGRRRGCRAVLAAVTVRAPGRGPGLRGPRRRGRYASTARRPGDADVAGCSPGHPCRSPARDQRAACGEW
jgi:hypothetical protein